MLDQIKNPTPCFKEVIHTHFWLKRNEICKQIEKWIAEMKGHALCNQLNGYYRDLRQELQKLQAPAGFETSPQSLEVETDSRVPPMTGRRGRPKKNN
jgi:baculoviral IAP repeat-containing protein 6